MNWSLGSAYHEHTYENHWRTRMENRKAVGIMPGGATCDYGDTTVHERDFPMDCILKGLDTTIQIGANRAGMLFNAYSWRGTS